MSAVKKLEKFRDIINKKLQIVLERKIDEAKAISPLAEEIAKQVADITLRGGKRIRAALLYYSYLAHGGKEKNKAMSAALAVELTESFLLIHDDIIDNDRLRRGGTTIHEFYGKQIDKQFGISMAILCGDLAYSWSNQILLGSGFDPKLTNKAVLTLNNTITTECYGEALDILSEHLENISYDDILKIHQLKTVPYTFDLPLKLGAILTGKNERDLRQLDGFINPLGIAFQIQDDILGMFGDEKKLGKPVTSDLAEGKKTLLILDSLENASRKDKQTILSALGNKNLRAKEFEKVKMIIIKTGALEKSKSLAKKLVGEAINNLKKTEIAGEGKDFLLGIAQYIIDREY